MNRQLKSIIRPLPCLLLVIASSMPLRAQLIRPVVTWVLDGRGGTGIVRPLEGTPGAASYGDEVARDVLSLNCQTDLCLVRHERGLAAVRVNPTLKRWPLYPGGPDSTGTDTPPGPTLFALSGSGLWVYFPETNQLARWRGETLETTEVPADGEILDIRGLTGGEESGQFVYAVAREDGTFIERFAGIERFGGSGETILRLPNNAGAVLLLDHCALTVVTGGIAIIPLDPTQANAENSAAQTESSTPEKDTEPTASEPKLRVIPIDDVGGFTRLAHGWIQIHTASGEWLLDSSDPCIAVCNAGGLPRLWALPPASESTPPAAPTFATETVQ